MLSDTYNCKIFYPCNLDAHAERLALKPRCPCQTFSVSYSLPLLLPSSCIYARLRDAHAENNTAAQRSVHTKHYSHTISHTCALLPRQPPPNTTTTLCKHTSISSYTEALRCNLRMHPIATSLMPPPYPTAVRRAQSLQRPSASASARPQKSARADSAASITDDIKPARAAPAQFSLQTSAHEYTAQPHHRHQRSHRGHM